MLRHPADDVALRDDPDDLTSLVDHRDGADPMLGENLDDRLDGLLRRDGDDIVTFVVQDRRNLCTHVSISRLDSQRRRAAVVALSSHIKTTKAPCPPKSKTRRHGRFVHVDPVATPAPGILATGPLPSPGPILGACSDPFCDACKHAASM